MHAGSVLSIVKEIQVGDNYYLCVCMYLQWYTFSEELNV
jgi:hypothetical protein